MTKQRVGKIGEQMEKIGANIFQISLISILPLSLIGTGFEGNIADIKASVVGAIAPLVILFGGIILTITGHSIWRYTLTEEEEKLLDCPLSCTKHSHCNW